MNDIVIYILIGVIVLLIALLVVLFIMNNKKNNNDKDVEKDFYKFMNEVKDQNSLRDKEINESLHIFKESVLKDMNEINSKIDLNIKEGFKTNKETIDKVNVSLGELKEAQKNLNNLNDEVTTLNEILNNNQSRGRFGEVTLETLIENIFGETQGIYDFQYQLSNTSRPDAVLYLNNKILCIDSKFSYKDYAKLFDKKKDKEDVELAKNFRSELKKEVTKVADSYIKPPKTFEYAIMFIPSDGIYSYIQSDKECFDMIVEYARSKYVVLCSPSTLQAVLANFKTLHINYEISKNISKMLKMIQGLKNQNENIVNEWNKINNAFDSIYRNKDEFNKKLNGFNEKADKILTLGEEENLIENKKDLE